MDKTTVYHQVDECLLEDMDGENLLYNPHNATTLHFNESSSLVWSLCDGERSVGDIVDVVCTAYPEQATQIEGDIMAVLNDFLGHSIIMESSSAKPGA